MNEAKKDIGKAKRSWSPGKERWCFLGLPFDSLTMEDVCSFIEDSIENKTTSTLSASNINWVVFARREPVFCEHIACSDLNVMDGFPLFWGARFLGLPIQERIAGPTIIERLMELKNGLRKKVYFLGGPDDSAQKACSWLKDSGGGLTGVGYCNPGFGSVDEMSSESLFKDIDRAAPDMLVLAIGAQKGMAWIEKNKKKITVGVLSYLGAVINLLAGHVKRAPIWMQEMGLEWTWRIFQEPKLWRRYLHDGLILMKMIVTRLVPLKIVVSCNKHFENERRFPGIVLAEHTERVVIRFEGVCNRFGRNEIMKVFLNAASLAKDVEVDLEGTQYIESSFLGNLFSLWRELRKTSRNLSIVGANVNIRRIFYLSMVDQFFKVGR